MRDQVRTSYNISPVEMVSKAIGGVAPIGWESEDLSLRVTIVIDEALSDYEVIWAAAGHPHTVFPTSFYELSVITSARSMKVGN